MIMTKYLSYLFLFLLLSCQEKPKADTLQAYKLVLEDGIYVESFDSTHVDENRYTVNNKVFKAGTEFVYQFYHETATGEKRSFKHDAEVEDYAKAWKFLDIDATDQNKIGQIKISVRKGLQPFIESFPDYNQTIIKFDYTKDSEYASFNSMSGVIENEKNIWIHPPRDKYFRILELNPFPFIQAPYEIGNTWDWSLTIGSSWGDKRWKTWEGNITNTYQYEITDKRTIKTDLGKIECFEIQSTATSRIGSTQLVALFSPIYGFVSLDYTNIDSTRTLLELVEFNPPK